MSVTRPELTSSRPRRRIKCDESSGPGRPLFCPADFPGRCRLRGGHTHGLRANTNIAAKIAATDRRTHPAAGSIDDTYLATPGHGNTPTHRAAHAKCHARYHTQRRNGATLPRHATGQARLRRVYAVGRSLAHPRPERSLAAPVNGRSAPGLGEK